MHVACRCRYDTVHRSNRPIERLRAPFGGTKGYTGGRGNRRSTSVTYSSGSRRWRAPHTTLRCAASCRFDRIRRVDPAMTDDCGVVDSEQGSVGRSTRRGGRRSDPLGRWSACDAVVGVRCGGQRAMRDRRAVRRLAGDTVSACVSCVVECGVSVFVWSSGRCGRFRPYPLRESAGV